MEDFNKSQISVERILVVRSAGQFFSSAINHLKNQYPGSTIDVLKTPESEIAPPHNDSKIFEFSKNEISLNNLSKHTKKVLMDIQYDLVVFLYYDLNEFHDFSYRNVEKVAFSLRSDQIMGLDNDLNSHYMDRIMYWARKLRYRLTPFVSAPVFITLALIALIPFLINRGWALCFRSD